MNAIIGTFTAPQEDMTGESLMLHFSPSSVPLQQRWRNNGLSADFLADYVSTFLPLREDEAGQEVPRDDIRAAVNFIANELLENAMKYSAEALPFPISVRLQLEDARVAFWETNTVTPAQAVTFRAFIDRLTTEDPNMLYLEQLERSAEGSGGSGLGFLTMINDYDAQLAWKFETASDTAVTVTTHVALAI